MKQHLIVNDIKPRIGLLTDVVYAQHFSYTGFRQLKMDILLPDIVRDKNGNTPPNDYKMPVIVYVVGGGFQTTNKERWIPTLKYFADHGFIVASIDYRTSNEDPFPAAIQDIKCAIRYLRKFSWKYGIDKNRIFLMGDSAGGYLAMMAALTKDVEMFDNHEWSGEDDSVRAVCSWFAPVDIETETCGEFSPTKLFLGKNRNDAPEIYEHADPIRYIDRQSPPVLIFHGTDDMLVNISNSELLYSALEKASVAVDYYTVAGAGHATIEFGQESMLQIILNFFNKHL